MSNTTILTNALDQFIISYKTEQGQFPNLNLVADNSNINSLGIFTQQDMVQTCYNLSTKYPNTYSWQEWYDALWHHFWEETIPGVPHNPPSTLELVFEETPPQAKKKSSAIWLIGGILLLLILSKKEKRNSNADQSTNTV